MFEKTTDRISHFLGSFEPYCPSSGHRLQKVSNFLLCIDLGHILKKPGFGPYCTAPYVKLRRKYFFSNSAKLQTILKIKSDKHGIR